MGFHEHPDIDQKRRLTKRCAAHIVERAALYPFTHVAREIGISATTVREIATSTWMGIGAYEFETPRYLGIDELILRDKSDKGKPGPEKRAVFVDLESGRVLDILRDNTKKSVARWIAGLPDRHRIRIVTTDFEATYRETARVLLPDALIVVDKWHAMKGIFTALDGVRVETLRRNGQRVFNDDETKRIRNLLRASRIEASDKDHGDDPRQILTQGRLRPGAQADAEAAGRTAAARAAC